MVAQSEEHKLARRFARALIPDQYNWGNPDLAREFAAAAYLCVLDMQDRGGLGCEDLTLELLRWLPARGLFGAMRTNRTWNGVVFNLGEFALTACQPRSR